MSVSPAASDMHEASLFPCIYIYIYICLQGRRIPKEKQKKKPKVAILVFDVPRFFDGIQPMPMHMWRDNVEEISLYSIRICKNRLIRMAFNQCTHFIHE